MSINSKIASKLVLIREELHELAGKLEGIARQIDVGVDELAADGPYYEDDPDDPDEIKIGDFVLLRTGIAYPEQYDAYYGDEKQACAYFRLRGGHFTVRVPDATGVLVYEERRNINDGCFENDEDRQTQLTAGVEHVAKYLLRVYRKNLRGVQGEVGA
jgi:hypothetical protein